MALIIFRTRVPMARRSIRELQEALLTATQPVFPLTRRRALTLLASVGTFAAAILPRAQAQQPAASSRPQEESKTAQQPPEGDPTSPNKLLTALHYEIDFKATPHRLYEAILDQKQFAAFSGMPATIDPTPGGAFALFGGLIEGRHIELLPTASPNPRIVQAWRPRSWPPGIYSLIHFEFKARDKETTLVFDHTSFPAGDYDHLDWGWHNHYWNPLKKFVG